MEAPSSEAELLQLLRMRLSDDRYSMPAFTLRLDDGSATDASTEIRGGALTTLVFNSSRAEDLRIDLAGARTFTIRRLIDYINAQPGYKAIPDRSFDGDHPSNDLRIDGFGDLIRDAILFSHRRFSDQELMRLLEHGCSRHNMNYTPAVVPKNEWPFVLTLAHAEALRLLATNAVKRRGLEATAESLIGLAASYEQSYEADRRRQARAVPSPEIRDDDVGSGDVVQGEVFRRSLRTGYMTPLANQLPPEPAVLFEVRPEDVTDRTVRLRWARVRDTDFYAMELWRDTREDVQRGRSRFSSTPQATSLDVVPTTSKLVFQAIGANTNFDRRAFATFYTEHGQSLVSFVDGLANRSGSSLNVPNRIAAPPLEPETEYFYRLFVIDRNGEVVDSPSVRARTMAMRAELDDDDPLDVVTGPLVGGTLVTMTGERFHAGMRVFIGDREASDLIIVSATSATFLTPEFFNARVVGQGLDVVVRSTNGLEDVAPGAWRYTA